VVGPSKQASKHTHKHGCNEVTLVWGSLRLAPITTSYRYFIHVHMLNSYCGCGVY